MMKRMMKETRVVPIPMLGIGKLAVNFHYLWWALPIRVILVETAFNP
jgi:hypothetical protein